MQSEILEKIANMISDLEPREKVREAIQQGVEQQIPVIDIVEHGLRQGLALIGQRYEKGEYFLAELLYSGKLIEDAFEFIKPYLQKTILTNKGIILLAAVKGDLHDIGKNVFKTLAEIAGFTVIDLGVDVDSMTIIQAIKQYSPSILGLSVLLTTVTPTVRQTIGDLNAAGLRDSLKVIIGGNAVDQDLAKQVGADAAALDAVEGIKICQSWM